jgi:translation initiation factor eIF-2B subunit epsilon
MIDYTIEWLAMAGVSEVFVFCSSLAYQTVSHIENFWKNHENFVVSCIVMHDCVSAREALRSIDQR